MTVLAYLIWDFDPEIFTIGGFTLRYYAVLFVLGIILSGVVVRGIFRDQHIPGSKFDLLVSYCFVGILLGARLGHCLFYEPGYFLSHPLEMFLPVAKSVNGDYVFVGYRGLAGHGATIGLLLTLFIYARRVKISLLSIFDYMAIVTPLCAFFIRLGNFFNSEIIGTVTDLPWAFVFKRMDDEPRHPAQLYEAIVYLLFFLLNLFLYKKYSTRLFQGFFFALNLILIGTFRFLIEFIKERQVAFEENLSLDMGQWLSLPFIIAGMCVVFYSMKMKRK